MWTCECTPIKAVFHGPGPKALMVLHGIDCDLAVEYRRTRVLPFLHSSKRTIPSSGLTLREAGSDDHPSAGREDDSSLPELPDLASPKEGPEDDWVTIVFEIGDFEIC